MDDNSGNIDNLVLGELDNTIDGDAVLNQYKTDINTTLLQLLNEKDPIKRYSIQKTLNSFRRKEMFYVIGVYIKKFIFYIIKL